LRYRNVVDLLANYTNTLGFFVGNEVASNVNSGSSNFLAKTYLDAYVKAAVRDVKAHIKQMSYRAIPLGYASSVERLPSYTELHSNEANYFNCGPTEDRVDFFGCVNMASCFVPHLSMIAC